MTDLPTGFQPQATADGSFTFYSPQFGETFHSLQGAQAEAMQKFVVPCLLPQLAIARPSVALLDVCYGLGYNTAAALTTIWSLNPACRVVWYGLENDGSVPQQAIALGLLQDYPPVVQEVLTALAQHQSVEMAQFSGRLWLGDARHTLCNNIPPQWRADAIFLDPFSPPKCPQLWTVEFLQALGDRLTPQGRLSTYCSAAAVRHALQLAGLHITPIPDPQPPHPRRRPLGTLASPVPLETPPLPPWEQEHLCTKAAIPYRDPTGIDSPEAIHQRRQVERENSHLESTNHWKKRWLRAVS